MSRLVLVNAANLEKLILKLGFAKMRQKGSHVFYRHADGRTTTIPFHTGRDIPRPLLRKILNEIKINVDEYNDLL
ncbi:MAG: type II toxin-antitoxin system HicA family toxin [Oscillospiraceae bacterium]|jgi:predicted RNA binding protein YcfA (HicA-like mRNA interferase family)|nr:type II toxin-antitoxin system HicA family toxin [Oscillospiraceae bacterium]